MEELPQEMALAIAEEEAKEEVEEGLPAPELKRMTVRELTELYEKWLSILERLPMSGLAFEAAERERAKISDVLSALSLEIRRRLFG
ncbi:MAG: hypothetical protein QXG57_06020 [Thermofilaceae archaeon]